MLENVIGQNNDYYQNRKLPGEKITKKVLEKRTTNDTKFQNKIRI